MKFFLVKLMYIGPFDFTETQFMCSNCHTVSKPVLENDNMWHGDPTGKSAYIFIRRCLCFMICSEKIFQEFLSMDFYIH